MQTTPTMSLDQLDQMIQGILAQGGQVPEDLLQQRDVAQSAEGSNPGDWLAKGSKAINGGVKNALGGLKNGAMGFASLFDDQVGPPKPPSQLADTVNQGMNRSPLAEMIAKLGGQGASPAAAAQPGADPTQMTDLTQAMQNQQGFQDGLAGGWDTPKQPQSVKDTVTDQATVDSPQTGLMPNVRETVMRGYNGTMLPAENMGIPGEEGGPAPDQGSNWSDRLKSVMSGLSLDDPRGQALMAASLGMLGARGTYGSTAAAIGQGGLQGMGAYQQARQTQSIDKYRDATLKQQSSLADRKEKNAVMLKMIDATGKAPVQLTQRMTAIMNMAKGGDVEGAQSAWAADPALQTYYPTFDAKKMTKDATFAQVKGNWATDFQKRDPEGFDKYMKSGNKAQSFQEMTLHQWNDDPSSLSPQQQEYMRLWQMGKKAEALALALRITNSDITGFADDSEEKIQNMGTNQQRLNDLSEPPYGVPRAGKTPGMVAKPAEGQAPSVAAIKAAGAQVKEKHPDWTDRQVAEEVHRQLQGQ